jgi:hypothetical protein
VAGGGGQDLALERDAGEDDVEGRQPIGGDQDAAAVRQIVIVADLAAIVASARMGPIM